MAHGPVKLDPAVERHSRMREDAYIYFRWTRRTLRTALLGFVIVPGTLFYIANSTQLRWDWVAKLKGQKLNVIAAKQDTE